MAVVVHNPVAVLNGVHSMHQVYNMLPVRNPEVVQRLVRNMVRSMPQVRNPGVVQRMVHNMQVVSSTEQHHKLAMYGVIQTEVAGKTVLGVQQAVPAMAHALELDHGAHVVAIAQPVGVVGVVAQEPALGALVVASEVVAIAQPVGVVGAVAPEQALGVVAPEQVLGALAVATAHAHGMVGALALNPTVPQTRLAQMVHV